MKKLSLSTLSMVLLFNENYFSIRRFILFGKSDLFKNATLSWRFIYMHNNKTPTDDHIYLQHCYLDIALLTKRL
jgi:hypothetical protein